jgi:hypothetical protein
MYLPPPLYLQLYSLWLVTESQRVMLQMVHSAIDMSRSTADRTVDMGQQAMSAMTAPIDMPHVESTPV